MCIVQHQVYTLSSSKFVPKSGEERRITTRPIRSIGLQSGKGDFIAAERRTRRRRRVTSVEKRPRCSSAVRRGRMAVRTAADVADKSSPRGNLSASPTTEPSFKAPFV